jgi:5-methylcytosine-specific restriction enzyme subunit McrC
MDVTNLALRRFGIFPPLRCSYQEYTVDREPNRRLLAAALGLAKAGDRRDDVSRTLGLLAARFEGVAACRYMPGNLTPLRRDRLLAHYDPALAVAEAVLQNVSLELPAGRTGAVAFVVDMNRVYERFVARALMEALCLNDRREWHMQPGNLYLDEGKQIPMRPDVLWTDERGRPRLVIDAKYKEERRATPQDVQQVVAYCSALGLRDAVLLYADCPEDVHVIRKSGIRVHQWRLSPGGTIDEVAQEVNRVAAALRALANVVDGLSASRN